MVAGSVQYTFLLAHSFGDGHVLFDSNFDTNQVNILERDQNGLWNVEATIDVGCDMHVLETDVGGHMLALGCLKPSALGNSVQIWKRRSELGPDTNAHINHRVLWRNGARRIGYEL